MALIKSNLDIFPLTTYSGTAVSYFKGANDLYCCLQIAHPASGTFQIAASVDENVPYSTKLWTVVPVKLLGSSTYTSLITFTDTEPTIIKFSCSPLSYFRATLTGSGGTYRAIYNAPTRQAEL